MHTGSGDITGLDSDRVTISHGPIESIEWSAMTMAFVVRSPDMVKGLAVGDPVQFKFRQNDDTYVLTSIAKEKR